MEFRRIKAYLKLLRVPTSLIAAGATVAGSHMGVAPPSFVEPFFSSLTVFFIAMGGFAFNDWVDWEKDKINTPQRPIPSGMIKRKNALLIGLILFFLGFLSSIMAGGQAWIISAIAIPLLLVYSPFLKRIGIIANLATAFLCSLTFIIGGMASAQTKYVILPAMFAFLFIAPREILLDMRDVEGDKKFNQKTLPVLLGKKKAVKVVSAIWIALMITTFIPYILGYFSVVYFMLVCVIFNVVLGFLIYFLNTENIQKYLQISLDTTRVLFLLGIVGFLFLFNT